MLVGAERCRCFEEDADILLLHCQVVMHLWWEILSWI